MCIPKSWALHALVQSSLKVANKAHYAEFLMRDTHVRDQHASYQSETSTSGRGDQTAKASTVAPGEGVLTAITGNQQVRMAQSKGPIFGEDFLVSNMLINW